jgi:sulfhydrogenase subunit gamma (sulfur reductase)
MIDPYLPYSAKILSVKTEANDVKLFRLKFADSRFQKEFHFWNGQFAMAGLEGLGEGAFNICSKIKDSTKFLEIAVRRVGRLTSAIHQLKKGQSLTLRGPFGKGWPKPEVLPKKNILLIGGGCGFIALRSMIDELVDVGYAKKHKVQVFYGCGAVDQLLFKESYIKWTRSGVDLQLIFDKTESGTKSIGGASCSYGLITKLFDMVEVVRDASAFVCGPEIMFRFAVEKLKKAGFSDQDIYLSLERKMHCGVGICQHCAVGEHYVCKNGPVFRYDEVINDI